MSIEKANTTVTAAWHEVKAQARRLKGLGYPVEIGLYDGVEHIDIGYIVLRPDCQPDVQAVLDVLAEHRAAVAARAAAFHELATKLAEVD